MPHWLVVLLVTLVAGWALAHFVSGTLAAIVVLVGVVYALYLVFGSHV